MSTPEIGDLWYRFRNGDHEAFATIFELYRKPVCRVIHRRLRHNRLIPRSITASDIFQDVFTSLMERSPQCPFATPEEFGAYLNQMAAN